MGVVVNQVKKYTEGTIRHLYIPYSFIGFLLSYSIHKSIILSFIHSLFGGYYVAYWVCTYSAYPAKILEWFNN